MDGTVHAALAKPAAAWPNYAAARVLVADDSAVNREVAIEALAFKIVPVITGIAAVAACQQTRYDVVLMDGSMPELDGPANSSRRRTVSTSAPVPIIALTAHVVGAGSDAWKRVGMNGV
jgi:two-component system sensor histidine kinase BarA